MRMPGFSLSSILFRVHSLSVSRAVSGDYDINHERKLLVSQRGTIHTFARRALPSVRKAPRKWVGFVNTRALEGRLEAEERGHELVIKCARSKHIIRGSPGAPTG